MAVVEPAGTTTDDGMVSPPPVLESDTVSPPVGAGPDRVMVPVAGSPDSRLVKFIEKFASTGGTTVTLVESVDEPMVA